MNKLVVLFVAVIMMCQASIDNSGEYAGSREDLHIQIYCMKYENGSFYMRLTWDKVKDADFYYVMLVSINNPTVPIQYNVTKREFIFDVSKGYHQDYETYGYVLAYPRNESWLHPTNFEDLAFCPKDGYWTEWSTWSECHVKTCMDVGRRYIERKCLSYLSESDNMRPNYCEPIPKRIEYQECLVDCEDEVVPDENNSTTMVTIDVKESFPDNPNSQTVTLKQVLVIVSICLGVFLLIIGLFIIYQRRLMKIKKNNYRTVSLSTGLTVYISYMTELQKENLLLKLIHHISTYGIQCIIDLLCQVDINSCGGLANWLPDKIQNADKILLILSPAYLKALDAPLSSEDQQICKVNSEFHFVKSMMYHSFQSTTHLVILLDGVKEEDVPSIFKDRIYCKFPKKFDKKDDASCQLIGLLLGEEPLRAV